MTIAETESSPPQITVTPLESRNCLGKFKCGERVIDKWAKDKSHKFQERRRSRVHCARTNGSISAIGFYSLSLSTETNSKILAADRDNWQNGAPFVYIEWLAVAKERQQCGIGRFLLMDALHRAYEVSKHVAPYGVALRSLNEKTTSFYKGHGFEIAPSEEATANPLMVLPIWSVIELFET